MRVFAFLVGVAIVGLGACAVPRAEPIHLTVGSKMFLGGTVVSTWLNSNPAVVEIEWRTDEVGRRQAWLIARQPGAAVLTLAGSKNSRVVGPTEVILNQSDWNNRQLSPPPQRPVVINVRVDSAGQVPE